jgi:hypothetical protein
VAAAVDAVLQAVAAGRLTPAEGERIAAIVESRRRVIETEEHEQRLQKLESQGGRATAMGERDEQAV